MKRIRLKRWAVASRKSRLPRLCSFFLGSAGFLANSLVNALLLLRVLGEHASAKGV